MSATMEAGPRTRSLTESRSARRPGRGNPNGAGWSSSAFLLPVVAVFVVLVAIPLVQTAYFSFTDFNGLSNNVKFVGFDNYVAVFTDSSMLGGLGFTLLYALSTTIVITVLAVPLAVTLNKRFLGRTFSRSLFFFIGVPAQAIIGLVWQYIFSPLGSGALNSVLGTFGIHPIPWLADDSLARFAVIFVSIWMHVGWYATLYLAYLQSVPADLYEQAQIDGANGRQQFWSITLPELVPALAISSFLLITNGLKVYDLPFTMTGGGPGFATRTITQSIILQISQSAYGPGSALAVLFTLACVIVILIQVTAAKALSRRFS